MGTMDSETSPLLSGETHKKRTPSVNSTKEDYSAAYPCQGNGKFGTVSRWRFWDPNSAGFRFLILILISFIPFGAHVVKSSVAALETEMTNDSSILIDHARFGVFQSAVNVPNLFIPFFGGLLLDLRMSRFGTLLFLSLCTIGHAIFTMSLELKSYWSAVLGRVLFGLGEGSVVVAQGAVCAHWFGGRQLAFAVGMTELSHNLANWLAKVYSVHASEALGGYVYSLWIGVGFCLFSTVCGILFCYFEKKAEKEACCGPFEYRVDRSKKKG
eukprot:Colp12_sorted_trinity150504_noHs@15427